MNKRRWKETFLLVWDVLFVLLLCFVVLLTTMLVGGSASIPKGGYTIHPLMLLGMTASLAIYLGFLLKNSLKSLRQLVHRYFHKREGR